MKKTAQLQYLLIQREAPEAIAQFGGEDLSKWPFWKRGDAYRLRGRAYSITKDGPKAESDLRESIRWTSESRTRNSTWLMLAQNREHNLGDDDRALQAYSAIVAGRERLGGADEYQALQGIARIQSKRGQFAEALETLNRATPERLKGTWQKNILKSIEAVNQAKDAAEK